MLDPEPGHLWNRGACGPLGESGFGLFGALSSPALWEGAGVTVSLLLPLRAEVPVLIRGLINGRGKDC